MIACAGGAPLIRGSSSHEGHRRKVRQTARAVGRCV